tara:strand:+ start:98785 stop:100065 length:1281 start_codon:yes stop_codon:yes gene_type:complete
MILGYSLRRTHGFLKTNHLIYITLSLLLFFSIHIKQVKFKITYKHLSIIGLIFSFFISINADLFYPQNKIGLYFIQASGALYFLYFLNEIFEKFKLSTKTFFFFIFLFFLMQLTTLFTSPSPVTDVFSVAQDGADFLLKGINPYTQDYRDVFNGRYGYVAGYVYWPGILLSLSPFRWLFGDVRYFYIFSNLFTIFLLLKLSHQLNLPKKFARSLTLIWTVFPVTFFVLEQTWTESLIIFQISLLIYSLVNKRLFFAALSLGYICATKQYNCFLALLVLSYIYKTYELKDFLKFTLVSFLTTLIFFMPFLIWDYQGFIKTTFLDILKYEPRGDSLSWYSWAYHYYNIKLPSLITLIAYFIPTFYGIYRVIKSKTHYLRELSFSLIFSYSFVFLLGKQAFCNYYYLLAFLTLLYIIIFIEPTQNQDLK